MPQPTDNQPPAAPAGGGSTGAAPTGAAHAAAAAADGAVHAAADATADAARAAATTRAAPTTGAASTTGAAHAAAAAAIADSPTQPPRESLRAASELAGAAGLERLLANLDGTIPPPPAWYVLGYRLTAVEHGRVEFELEPMAGHSNYGGTVHGGVISALADSAMACAVLSVLDADHWCATIELKVNMLRPVPAPGQRLRAVGTVRWRGGTTAIAEAALHVGDQEVAVGLSTHAIRAARRLAGGPTAPAPDVRSPPPGQERPPAGGRGAHTPGARAAPPGQAPPPPR